MGEAVADHDVVGVGQGDGVVERVEVGEVVGVVGIGHDDDAAVRRPDPRTQGVAVADARFGDDTGTSSSGVGAGGVGRRVVDDKDLAGELAASDPR